MKDVDVAIEDYRKRLRAQGEIADSDLDELEDHLRELTYELRTAGMSAAEAVTEAARRLGDPYQLAREHARVRPRFGVPLSTGRAVSAAVLFVLPHIVWTVSSDVFPDWRLWLSWWGLGTYSIIAIALAARKTWARAIALGMVASFFTRMLIDPFSVSDPLLWGPQLGVLAFVIPWRRNEVSLAAVPVALLAYAACSARLMWHPHIVPIDDAQQLAPAFERIAFACAIAACVGTVLRARWSAIASALSALALFGAMGELLFAPWGAIGSPAFRLKWQICMLGGAGSGAIAAAVAAVLSWRTLPARTQRGGEGTKRNSVGA